MSDIQGQLLEMVEKMPAFPASVNRVIELSSSTDCNYKELIKVIEHDPVMTLKVLKMVNSAYFGLSREITTINHSVVYLGLNTVKNLAISIASIGMLPFENEAGLNMKKFLHHSLSTAALSRMLSKQVGISEKDASDYFVAGLLHDFGKIVFVQFMPKKFKKALVLEKEEWWPLVSAEKEIIGVDHTEVGVLLGKKWNLPPGLLDAIDLHHSGKNENNEGDNLLTDIVYVTNLLSRELDNNVEDGAFSEGLIKDISVRFGDNLDKCLTSPKELRDEIEKSLHFMS